MLNKKQIVITGCAGFIGTHLTHHLLAAGHHIYGIDNFTYAANQEFIYNLECRYPNTFTFLEQDICTLERLPNCDYVINLAAESHVDNSINDSSKFVRTNIDGTTNLLKLILNSIYPNKPVFIQMSTDEVYGDGDKAHEETDLLNPSSPYAASKASADLLIQAYARTYGIKYKIARPSNTYGIRQYPEKLIPLAVKQLQFGRKIYLHDMGLPTRTWTHVDDVCEALELIIEKGEQNSIYNITSGFELQNRTVIDTIIKLFYNNSYSGSFEGLIDFSHSRMGQDVRYKISSKKLHNLTGWKAERDFYKALKGCVDYYKNEVRW